MGVGIFRRLKSGFLALNMIKSIHLLEKTLFGTTATPWIKDPEIGG